jgi:hypothetical protein
MTRADYELELLTELEKNKQDISTMLDMLLENISEKIKGIYIGIFPSQDGDGMFSIHANADGPDLYVRQQEIKEYASLFNPIILPGKIEPFVPTFYDPFNVEFDVNECLVDLVANWFYSNFSGKVYPQGVTFSIVGAEDYGTVTPLFLQK